jgi:hypothetical protein
MIIGAVILLLIGGKIIKTLLIKNNTLKDLLFKFIEKYLEDPKNPNSSPLNSNSEVRSRNLNNSERETG